MRMLTVKQPWAGLIAAGVKRIENRTWPTSHRGPVAIHAGLSKDNLWALDEPHVQPHADVANAGVRGAIVAVGIVLDCVPFDPTPWLHADPFACGPWCWLLGSVRAIDPVPCKGGLGLLRVPDATLELIRGAKRLDRRTQQAFSWNA